MQDSIFVKLAIITSLVGLTLLMFLSEFIDLDYTKIDDIDDSFLDKKILIQVRIDSVKETNKTYSLRLSDSSGYIRGVIFDKEAFTFKKGDFVDVKGKVDEYLGYYNIAIDKITPTVYAS